MEEHVKGLARNTPGFALLTWSEPYLSDSKSEYTCTRELRVGTCCPTCQTLAYRVLGPPANGYAPVRCSLCDRYYAVADHSAAEEEAWQRLRRAVELELEPDWDALSRLDVAPQDPYPDLDWEALGRSLTEPLPPPTPLEQVRRFFWRLSSALQAARAAWREG